MSFVQTYPGWARYRAELHMDSHRLLVAVRCTVDDLPLASFGLLDAAAEWCELPSYTVATLELDPTAGERVRMETRSGLFAGGLQRLPLTFVATEGQELAIDATWLVSADWPGPLVLGWKGCLERMRFALDRAEERFYFGSWYLLDGPHRKPTMFWSIITAVATVVSMIAYVVTALYVRAELRQMDRSRFLQVTNDLYATWQSREFLEAQLWLLHRLEETTWEGFVAKHRGDVGEAAFHRVGSFYDRVGTLVRLRFIDEEQILSTIGAYAIAVWQKLEPLVREARRIENSVLFDDFERLLPACYECYVPALGKDARVIPFSIEQPADRISREELQKRLKHGEKVTLLDVRNAHQFEENPKMLPHAVHMTLDELPQRYQELPRDREVVAYCA
jgi:hypothetical protein